MREKSFGRADLEGLMGVGEVNERREGTEAKRGGERNGRNRTAREELFLFLEETGKHLAQQTGQATWRKEWGAAPPASGGCWGDEGRKTGVLKWGRG